MNGSYLRSAKMILVGSIIGGLLAWLIRPPLIGLTLGIVIGLKIGAITKWTDGVRHGAIIGFIVGASIAPFASVVNGIMIVDLISFGIFGQFLVRLLAELPASFSIQRNHGFGSLQPACKVLLNPGILA